MISRANKLSTLLILFVGLLIYSNSFHSSFHFDDDGFIVSNDQVKYSKSITQLWTKLKTPDFQCRILPFYTFNLNYRLGALNVEGYHVVNLAIHIINAILVRIFCLLLFSTPRLRETSIYEHREFISFGAALIFLTHPLQIQSVTYIAQRFASMATMFYVASLCCYLKARLSAPKSGEMFAFSGGAFICAVAGMLSKQIVFTLPVMMLVIEASFFNQVRFKEFIRRRWRLLVLLLVLILVLPVLFRFDFQLIFGRTFESQSIDGEYVSFGNYLFTQFRVIPTYIRLLFFPVGLNLDYQFAVSKSFFEFKTLAGFLFLMSIVLLSFYSWRKKQFLIAFGIWWFFIALAVESSFIPIRNVIFEHRTYLPSVGFSILLSSCMVYFLNERARKVILVLIICILSVMTFLRNRIWKDEITLWSDVVKKSPDKSRPYLNLGNAYFLNGQYEEAIKGYNKSIEYNPGYYRGYNNRAVTYLMVEQYDLAEKDYNKALEINPLYAEAFGNRGIVHQKRGNIDLAIADYTRAIELNPEYANVYSNRANLYTKKGMTDAAIKDFSMALEKDPHDAVTFNNRGNAYLFKGQLDLAEADFNQSITLDKGYFDPLYNRGLVYKERQLYDEALKSFNKALAMKPDHVLALSQRADIYAKRQQYDLAYIDYSHIIGLKSASPQIYYNRAIVGYYQEKYPQALADALKAKEGGYSVDPNFLQKLQNLSR